MGYYKFLSRFLEIGMSVGILGIIICLSYLWCITYKSCRYTDILSKKVYGLRKGIITEDVEDNALAIARSKQVNKPERGKEYLEREE